MIPQYDSMATSSFMLFFDNRICSQSGFYNVSTLAYPITVGANQTNYGFMSNGQIRPYSVYSFPFSQIIADNSIVGTNKLSGIYINNSFITVGNSGLSGINFDKGQVYIDPNNAPQIQSISGIYSVKEINVTLSEYADSSVLFETKLALRNKFVQKPTGLNNNQITYPVCFIENASAPTNSPWQIGGIDQTRSIFNLYFFGDTLFQKNNFMSLCKDMAWKYVPLILNPTNFPFNNLGYYINTGGYNYNQLTTGYISSGTSALIEDVTITEFGKRGILSEIENMTTESYFTLVTVTMWTSRLTR